MSSATAGWLQAGLLVAALAVCYVPLGNYMARIFTTEKDWKIERGIYKLIGVNSKADQNGASTSAASWPSRWSACYSCTASSGCSTTCC